ncbi:MAG: ABC transporter ATP-binding protein [Treponema sp.]
MRHISTKKYVAIYLIAIAFLLVSKAISATVPLIIPIIVDGAVLGNKVQDSFILRFLSSFFIIKKGFSSILILSIIMLFFAILAVSLGYITDVLNSIATENIIKNLRSSLHAHIGRFTYEHYTKQETGDLIQRCTSNVDTIKRTLAHFAIHGLGIIFSICYIITLMIMQSVKMTLISSFTVPIIFVGSLLFFIYIKKQDSLAYKKEALMTQVAQENLTGVRVVKAFSMQEYEMKKFEQKSKDYRNANLKINLSHAFFWSINDAIILAQVMFVTIYGSYLAYLGSLSVGQVVLFTQYVTMLVFPVRHLGRIVSNMANLTVSIKRIKEVFTAPSEDVSACKNVKELKGELAFNNISFSYSSSKEKEVLRNVSFTIKEGEMLGVVGMTGSGKTSLMYLLERLYNPNEGSIKIGDKDISKVDLTTLRHHIGIVLQEPFLYSKTIKENIRLSRPEASDEDVVKVAKQASLHKDIMEFELGYETVVGENGITLSGGQKQRLAIARTLLTNAKIIIFDDSLSSVDTTTDAEIRASIAKIREEKILIVISHRLSSVMDANKIIVLDKGVILEEGTHNELLAKNGNYKRIYEIQNAI